VLPYKPSILLVPNLYLCSANLCLNILCEVAGVLRRITRRYDILYISNYKKWELTIFFFFSEWPFSAAVGGCQSSLILRSCIVCVSGLLYVQYANTLKRLLALVRKFYVV